MSYLYSTFVMRNDSFIPGALVFGYSLKKQGITDPVICFVTNEVSPSAQGHLRSVFDEVIMIDSVEIPHPNQKGRQDRSFLFTRLEILKYTHFQGQKIEKIIVCDSDILPLANYQDLKEVPSHAAILNESKDTTAVIENHQYVISPAVLETGTWRWHEIYKDIPHGTKVPKSITDRVLTDESNLGMNTSIWVFKPSNDSYKTLMNDLAKEATQEKVQTYNWPEMQYLTGSLSGQWHNIDIKYASFNGYPRIDLVYGIHFAGVKPWAIQHRSFEHYSKFPDFRLWQAVFLKMMRDVKGLSHYPKLLRIKEVIYDQFKDEPVTPIERHHAPYWV